MAAEVLAAEDVRATLEQAMSSKEGDHINRATAVGRAAMYLLGARTSANFPVSPEAALPKGATRIHDPRVRHTLGIHNSTISGDPSRVSLLRQTTVDGTVRDCTVVSVPQDDEAADGFRLTPDGLFVLEGTHRSFAAADPTKYEQELARSAGMLLELLQVEVEPAEMAA